jgi:hypothetical protein
LPTPDCLGAEHVLLQSEDVTPFLEKLVGDLQNLSDGTGSLSVMLNENGGIIDDTVITKVSPTEIYMVLNAGCADKDLAHIRTHLAQRTGDVQLTVHDDSSLLALPESCIWEWARTIWTLMWTSPVLVRAAASLTCDSVSQHPLYVSCSLTQPCTTTASC